MAGADPPARFNVKMAAADDPLLGMVVNGKYRVESVVATGGMGRIYRAEQLPLGRTVALKVLNPQYTQSNADDAFQKRFFLEASILSKLQHPNIVTVFDYGCIEATDPEAYFMAMEFLAGETLHKRLNKVGALAAPEAIGLARQLARGLREAHGHDVVHRDLKPSNVMLIGQEDGSELVKIVDFGLVKVLTDDTDQVTKEGTFLGSPRYMSPEQIAHGRVDHRTDIYSLGVILYQVLSGALPFDNDHAVQTLMAHLHNPVPWMTERNPLAQVPEQLELFVRRCLEKDPAGRPANMEEFTREITEIEKSLGFSPAPGTAPGLSFDYDTGSGKRRPLVQPLLEIRTGPNPSAADVEPLEPPTIVNPPPKKTLTALPIVLTALGAVAIVVFGGLLLMRNRASGEQPAPALSADSAQHRDRFTLSIQSVPSGAEVFDGDKSLGKTPLNVDVENAAAQQAPRKLVLRQDGYLPYSVEQGPSQENVRTIAALVAAPAEAAAPPASTAAAPTRTTAPPPVKAPPAKTEGHKPPDTDIKLTR
jgi:eukaryotic-like serine/threonine-protein kinase